MPIPTPIVLISANGMLGRAWRGLLEARELPHAALSRPAIDLREPATVEAAIPDTARLVVNCAAWTDVDGAEADEAGATRVNGGGVRLLAERCGAIGATLVHYSTDYVFNGRATTPYRADEPRDPLNAYGRSKAAGEAAIEQSGCDHLIVRTSWLYAPWGKNFVRTMAKLTAEKPELKVVNDQRGRPTSAEHLARTTLAMLEKGARGIHHVTDGGECTWYDFTAEINRQLGHACAVRPCTTAEFPRPAKRPAYSVLDLSRTEVLVGPMPDWKENLADVLKRLEPL